MRQRKGNQIYNKLGDNIYNLREKRNLSRKAVCETLNIHRTYLNRIELGEENPSLDHLINISRNLKIKLIDLFKNIG